MKLKLSTSCASYYDDVPMPILMETVRSSGFHMIDFWLYKYSSGADAPLMRDDWRKWAAEINRVIRDSGLIPGQAHCLYDVMLNEDYSVRPAEKVFYRSIEVCAMMGIDKLVFHPAFYRYHHRGEETRQRILAANAKWFLPLLPAALDAGVMILPENTFDFDRLQTPEEMPFTFTTMEDVLALISFMDGGVHTGVCLDTGHANIARQDISAMIRQAGTHLKALHLNDNYGQIDPVFSDLHLFPGQGRVRWPEVFSALAEIGYDGSLNLEPVGELRKMSLPIRKIQLTAAAATLRMMAREAGLETED